MKKGRMYHPPLRYVVPVRDIDIFSDGCLWTLHVLEEDLEWVDGHRYIKKNARIVHITRQTPRNSFTEVRVRNSEINRIKKRFTFALARGGLE